MKFDDYQREALKTDQFPGTASGDGEVPTKAELVPLLGLVGEVGSLLSEYKKLLRDGPVHLRFRDQVEEELGDMLWYVAVVASKYDLSLGEIASKNLAKIKDRWEHSGERRPAFDSEFDDDQRLPEMFTYTIAHRVIDGREKVVVLDEDGQQVGNPLTDNSDEPDGYRYHDVMHLAFVALLGWSPVVRKLLGRKRHSDPRIDEVQDGGRATVIDEAIVAMVFEYAERHLDRLKDAGAVDTEMLRSIKRITSGLEVSACTSAEWERAILAGFKVWAEVQAHGGGTISGDYASATFEFTARPE